MCPHYVWHRRRRLAAGKKERMWRALQAVLPGEEHMLATNRTFWTRTSGKRRMGQYGGPGKKE